MKADSALASIMTIQRSLRATAGNLARKSGAEVSARMIEVDHGLQQIGKLLIEAQVRFIEDPDSDCEDLVKAAEYARDEARAQ